MTRRSKEELLKDFHRLSDIFETLAICVIEEVPELGKLMKNIISREQMLRRVSDNEATMSQIIEGTQQGLNDMLSDLEMDLVDGVDSAPRILGRYKEKTKRNLFEDVGSPSQLAKAIVRRGSIRNDTEFYVLNDVLSNVEQMVLRDELFDGAQLLIEQYEASPK